MDQTNERNELLDAIVQATVAADEEKCVSLAHRVLEEGLDPFEAIHSGYSRGMAIVGERFAKLEIYLPQVVLAADAMNAAVEILKPHLLSKQGGTGEGVVVIATIQGDIHDLGKNIVKIMLQAAGFTVHDLGSDVPVRRLIDKACELEADIIAASAILTTTMTYMPEILASLQELGLRERFKVLLGGAPVMPDWVASIGGDGYGEDALEAVAAAKRLMQQKRGG